MFTLESKRMEFKVSGTLLGFEYGGGGNNLYLTFGKKGVMGSKFELIIDDAPATMYKTMANLTTTGLNTGYIMDMDTLSLSKTVTQ